MNQNYQLDSATIMAKLIPQLIKAKNTLTQEDWDKLIDSLKYSWGCNKCGKLFHFTKKCPASGRHCNFCGKMGHFSAVCLYKMTKARTQQYRKTQNYKLTIPVGSSVLVRERSSKQWVIEGTVVQHSGDKYRILQADGTFSLAYPWFVKNNANVPDEIGYFELPADLAGDEIMELELNREEDDVERLEPLYSIEQQYLVKDEGNEAELLDPSASNEGLADSGDESIELLEPAILIEDNEVMDDGNVLNDAEVEILIDSTDEQDTADKQHQQDDDELLEPATSTEEQEPTDDDGTLEPATSDEGCADNENETSNNGNEEDGVETLELDASNEEKDSTNNGNELNDADILKPDNSTEGQVLSGNEPQTKDVEPLKPSSDETQTPVTVNDVEPPKPASNEGPVAQNTEVKESEPLNPAASNDSQTAVNNEEKPTDVEPLKPSSSEAQTPEETTVSDVEPSKPASNEGEVVQNTEVKEAEPLNPVASNDGQTAADHEQNVTEPTKPSTSNEKQVVQNSDAQVTPPESSTDGQSTTNDEVKASDVEPLKPAASNEQEDPREN